jgi:hypothetical protein
MGQQYFSIIAQHLRRSDACSSPQNLDFNPNDFMWELAVEKMTLEQVFFIISSPFPCSLLFHHCSVFFCRLPLPYAIRWQAAHYHILSLSLRTSSHRYLVLWVQGNYICCPTMKTCMSFGHPIFRISSSVQNMHVFVVFLWYLNVDGHNIICLVYIKALAVGQTVLFQIVWWLVDDQLEII